MAFLQSRNNLGDLESLMSAKDNLGLGSLSAQMQDNVNIQNGSVTVSKLRLLPPSDRSIGENFVLTASNDTGAVVWKEMAVASWLNRAPAEISLASLCNDVPFVTTDQLAETLSEMSAPTLNTLIGNELVIEKVSASNIAAGAAAVSGTLSVNDVFAHQYRYADGGAGSPSVMTNGAGGNNLQLSPLEHAYSNDALDRVCSTRAVSNLYSYVEMIARNVPDDSAGFMISTNNFSDRGLDPAQAVFNLGLNTRFQTDHLTVKDAYFTEPSYNALIGNVEFDFSSSKNYKLLKEAKTNRLVYEENKLIHDFTDRSQDFPASAYNVNELYEHLDDKIRSQLLAANVLSEIVDNLPDGTENPYRSVFKQRLRTAGVQEIAFSGNWNDVVNAPQSLSAFQNTDGNAETLFLYSKSNLSDLPDKIQALRNLGVADVAISGNIADLNISGVLRNIVDNEASPSGIPAAARDGLIPFLAKENYLSELSDNAAMARANLGIGDIATFDRMNVDIAGGTATFDDFTVASNLHYKNNEGAPLDSAHANHVFLKCFSGDGYAKWSTLPAASTDSAGIVRLTNDYSASDDSNVALSAHAASSMFAFLMNEIQKLQ